MKRHLTSLLSAVALCCGVPALSGPSPAHGGDIANPGGMVSEAPGGIANSGNRVSAATGGRQTKNSERIFTILSPDGRLSSEVRIGDALTFTLADDKQPILAPSRLAMRISGAGTWGESPRLLKARRSSVDDVIVSPFYKRSEVRDRYNELALSFKGNYSVVFRMYDDGLAYRFATSREEAFTVETEVAEYRMAQDFDVWAPYVKIKAKGDPKPSFEKQFFNSMQNLYTHCKASELKPECLVFTPVLADLGDGSKLCFAESDLESYPGMYLNNSDGDGVLRGVFAPYPKSEELGGHNKLQMLVTQREGFIAKVNGPRSFPWRSFIVTRRDGELTESDMVYRLAAPSRVEDVSWIKPGKVAWEWWNDWGVYNVDFRSGINTQTYKYYIDFASRFGLEYVILDEGWSVKYEGDLLKVVPEIDLPGLVDYARSRGVDIILWAGYHAVERNMEAVVEHYSKMGVKGFKVDFLDRDDQKMLDFMYRLAEVCAKHRMLVDYHGVCKPSGLQRTFPNVVNYEAVFGLEQMKWSSTKTDMVTYDVTLPFIRMVAGPMDYTQGAMRNTIKGSYTPNRKSPMSQGTRCRQLAEYVVFDSPLTMLCDSPTNYLEEEECIRFIAGVPTVWDDTKVLEGSVGSHIVVARRSGDEWFVGAMTDWSERESDIEIPVGEGDYEVEIFRDGINADRYAEDYKREVLTLPADRRLTVRMAPGGGWAARVCKTDRAAR